MEANDNGRTARGDTVNLAESATEFCNYPARSRDNFEISSRFAREHTTNNFKGKVSHASS